jgi:hypothetical protein
MFFCYFIYKEITVNLNGRSDPVDISVFKTTYPNFLDSKDGQGASIESKNIS